MGSVIREKDHEAKSSRRDRRKNETNKELVKKKKCLKGDSRRQSRKKDKNKEP